MAIETKHKIQIFFIGIGDEVDLDLGRMLAEASGAEYIRTAEEALANVIDEFGRYF